MDPVGIVDALSHGLTHDADEALSRLGVLEISRDTDLLAATVFLRVLSCQFDGALNVAQLLGTRSDLSPMARAAKDLAIAVCAGVVSDEAGTHWPDDGPFAAMAAMLEVEAALSAGLISRAAARAALLVQDGPIDSPTTAWNVIALVRARSFEGRFEDADRLIARVLASPSVEQWPQLHLLARGAKVFVDGNLGRDALVQAGLVEFQTPSLEPRNYIWAGTWVMAAFGAAATGRLQEACDLVLAGGGGLYLPRLQIVDRLYGYEILLEAALQRGDLAAARLWSEYADGLPIRGHLMASAALGRIHARLALAAADTAGGIAASADSGALARLVGSDLEVIRARIIESSGRLAAGDRMRGIDELEEAARQAGATGAAAVKEWAERELRQHGRRLRNSPGLGWDTLSDTQQQIARLAAAGLRNREIAATLWISGKTVESHIATILAALGATNRVGIGRELGGVTAEPNFGALLTARQREVAQLVARGHTNADISRLLGISPKTVEKHVNGLFARLGVKTRSAIAARVRGTNL